MLLTVDQFIQRWKSSGASERANYVMFLTELCQILDLPQPDPAQADDSQNTYVFEKSVHLESGSTGRIDLYRKSAFVLEAKQGADDGEFRTGTAVRSTSSWDAAMERAKNQAYNYAKALPEWPPFLIAIDVGHSFELYADFSGLGKNYKPFPKPGAHRLLIDRLADPAIRDLLQHIWLKPLDLDPSLKAAKVTREITRHLADLAHSLENRYSTMEVATFLQRLLFTMFAEDIGLLPPGSYRSKLQSINGRANTFKGLTSALWRDMNTGGFSATLCDELLRFNGGMFEDATALDITENELQAIIVACELDWSGVEPSIFGSLFERALDPKERHALGAHYTPRSYVERLVVPTIIQPLREEFENAKAAAFTHLGSAKANAAILAVGEIEGFLQRLSSYRVLDPACGAGNFLYVAMDLMKAIEYEAKDFITQQLGQLQPSLGFIGSVTPAQFLGIEKHPLSAKLAELVLWIGDLQWHFRMHGNARPAEPVLRSHRTIECRDAVLDFDSEGDLLDADGRPITRWDGTTMKRHPVTDELVPDETAQVSIRHYAGSRRAEWPKVDFIVGNPPFIGGSNIRAALGDGYAEALRKAHDDLPNSIDFVMYWWDKAAEKVRNGEAQRFGFITTNSLPQTFSRRVVVKHLEAKRPLSILFAISDHPWARGVGGGGVRDAAAVRVAMTVGAAGEHQGVICRVTEEQPSQSDEMNVELNQQVGKIHANLKIGTNVASAIELKANSEICSRGVVLHGAGFVLNHDQARSVGLGRIPELDLHVRPYRNGKDLTAVPRRVFAIDLFGLSENEVRDRFPDIYQWVLERVKPERDHNKRDQRRLKWWLFGENIPRFRHALTGLPRYIATVETAKHRVFQFLDAAILPDNMLVATALDDAYFLGILSSRIHLVWARAAGGTLEDRPRYNKTRCFDPFPFPACDEETKIRIRNIAEQLDRHRKDRQSLHPELTITAMYNVLEKLSGGAPLDANEKVIHENGLISILKHIHDDLDAAVDIAYGWPSNLSEDELLERLVALNHERAAEENRGLIRWIRPDFQAKTARSETQIEIDIATVPGIKSTPAKKHAWPKTLPEQVQAVRAALTQSGSASAISIGKAFTGARQARVDDLLAALVALGQARKDGDRYTT